MGEKMHPALDHKYQIVQFTRGAGIEVGEGITDFTEPLYPHFRKDDVDHRLARRTLDFVLVAGHEGTDRPHPFDYIPIIKDGGYLISSERSGLRVWRVFEGERHHSGIVEQDLTIQGPSVCVVRYGGFGDMIQAANILPALKRAGFTVYVMTTPKGREIIEHDPHVDHFLLQDTDQVPNGELSAYWAEQAKRFTKFVNLSESVEGTLLTYPGRANHAWPDSVRRSELGSKNYLEWTAKLAEIDYTSETRFYPTDAERAAVERFMSRIRLWAANAPAAGPVNAPPTFNIMWTLSGSSVHKMYPHQDDVIANLLQAFPDATITLSGDDLCRMLEAGWEDHPRVHCTSGKIGIRETLALAQAMDCVVGPETGVLNAVGFEPMGKVVLLSHSSPENLTKHWVNTHVMQPFTDCHPCHRLHHDRTFCREHEISGAAQCAWDIPPYSVFTAIAQVHGEWKQLRDLRHAA